MFLLNPCVYCLFAYGRISLSRLAHHAPPRLLGFAAPHALREWLQHEGLVVEAGRSQAWGVGGTWWCVFFHLATSTPMDLTCRTINHIESYPCFWQCYVFPCFTDAQVGSILGIVTLAHSTQVVMLLQWARSVIQTNEFGLWQCGSMS